MKPAIKTKLKPTQRILENTFKTHVPTRNEACKMRKP